MFLHLLNSTNKCKLFRYLSLTFNIHSFVVNQLCMQLFVVAAILIICCFLKPGHMAKHSRGKLTQFCSSLPILQLTRHRQSLLKEAATVKVYP